MEEKNFYNKINELALINIRASQDILNKNNEERKKIKDLFFDILMELPEHKIIIDIDKLKDIPNNFDYGDLFFPVHSGFGICLVAQIREIKLIPCNGILQLLFVVTNVNDARNKRYNIKIELIPIECLVNILREISKYINLTKNLIQ